MSLRKTKSGNWQLDYYPEGRKGKRERITLPEHLTEQQAREYEIELRQTHRYNNKPLVNPKISHIWDQYIVWAKLHRSPQTVKDYLLSWKTLEPIVGNLQVTNITRSTIESYKAARKTQNPNISNRTINKELNYLQAIISWMVRNNLAKPLPFKVELLPYTKPLPQFPDQEDVEKFIAEIKDPRNPLKSCFIMLLATSGLRFGEAANVKWENIDWKAGTIKLIDNIKGNKQRNVPLHPAVIAELEPRKQTSGYIFINPRSGKPYTKMQTQFKAACERAGIRQFSPHKLRHYGLTMALKHTGNLRLVQELAGHADIRTTTIYTHVVTDEMHKAISNSVPIPKKRKTSVTTPEKTKPANPAKKRAKD